MNGAGELGIVTIDRAATILSWNDWLASATGLSEADARGRPLLSLVPAARAGTIGAFVDEVLATGSSRVLAPAFHHYLIACPPSEPSPHFTEMQQFVTIAPLLSGAGVVGAMVTIEDVTAELDRQRDLMAELERDADGGRRSAAVEAVGAGDWQLRGLAVRNLRQRASAAEIAHLLETLRRGYQDLNVVSSALQVLAANRDVTTPLIELLSDPQADLRMHAALALGSVGDPVAVPALVAALDDHEPNVQFHAIEALGVIGAGDAVDRLTEIAASGDFFLSFPAISALAQTADPRVAAGLTSLLDNELLRPAVVDTLAAIGDEDAVAPLAGLLNRGVDGDSVAAIAAALERIRAREEEAFGAGAHIVDLARRELQPPGIAALAAAVEGKRQPLSALVAVLGWSAARADALVAAVGNPDVETEVAAAVMAIGRGAVDPLIDRLADGDRAARIASASLLGGLADTRAVGPLAAVLEGADAELTATAAAALARLGDAAALDPLLALFGHEQAVVRQAAIAAVNSIGAAPTAGRIAAMIEDRDPRIRASAVRVAGYFGFEECLARVRRHISDPDEEVRRAVIEQLPMLDDPGAVPVLMTALTEESPRNRAAAAHALRQVHGVAATEALIAALEDDDVWVRYFAADALGPRGGIAAVPALTQMAQSDPAPHVRLAALQTLTRIDAALASDIAVPLVGDGDPEVAAAALTAVAAGSHPEGERLLEQAIATGDAFMRRSAVRALAARHTSAAVDLLARAATLTEPADLPQLVIESLTRLASAGDDAPLGTAVAALMDLAADPETRDAAVRAMAGLPERTVDDLAAALRATHPKVKLTAIEALARMRHPRASEALRVALHDEDAVIRRAAVAAFGRLGSRTAAADIGRLRVTDPDANVRRLAAAMCRRHRWEASPGR